jgi:uncharacterized C2H2 Zn-finger protein
MIRHLARTRKCPRNLNSYKYTESDIQELSLILHKDPNSSTKKNITKEDLTCPTCQKIFSRKDNLNTHMKKACKMIIIEYKKNESKVNINYNNDFSKSNIGQNTEPNSIPNIPPCSNTNIQNNVLNIENQTNIENHTNNIIILNPSLQPFDNQWSMEHIDKYISQVILLSENKYTNLLGEILKNKENLNVIIDKNSPYGLVYKNDNDMYVNMKVNEIIEQSMKKLYEQLNVFYANFATNDILKINKDIIEKEKRQIENKFNDYCNNKNDVKQIVENLLEDIYEKNKAEAVEIAEKMLTYKNSICDKIGY